MKRVVRFDYRGPQPVDEHAPESARDEMRRARSRSELLEEAQKKILAIYAETFRRLAG
jgi:hypothetical protein